MFIYNTTINVGKEILHQWLIWQKEEHIPEIMATNLFTDIKFYKLLEPGDEDDSTFILQYHVDTKQKYDRFITEYAQSFKNKSAQKWGDDFIDFNTLMQTVH